MSIEEYRLVGFSRQIPDVYTFVTPVFSRENIHSNHITSAIERSENELNNYTQVIGKSRVVDFDLVCIEENFKEVHTDIIIRCGSLPFFGFEISESSLLIGHANQLSAELESRIHAIGSNEGRRYTLIAINRFIEMARQNVYQAEADKMRIYHFIRNKVPPIEATGKVKWFNNAKGYGFIRPDSEGDDLFVHYSYFCMDGHKSLKPGQKVAYDIRVAPKGPHAVNIRIVDEYLRDYAFVATKQSEACVVTR